MRKINLSLEISVALLASCIQVVKKFGDLEEAEGEELPDIILGVLESTLEGLAKDGYIEVIRTEEEAERILGPFLASDEEKNLLFEIQEAVSHPPSSRQALPIPSPSKENLEDLEEPKKEGEEEGASSLPLSIQLQSLKNLNIPDDDPLLAECRGDVVKEKALFDVYSVVKREAWGGAMARAILTQSLNAEDN